MSKLMSLHDAIRDHVHPGDLVYASGFTHLIPFAAGHEIIRQGLKDLTLARATPDLIYDQMVAAGCARKLIFSYIGNPGVAPCTAFGLPSNPASWSGRNTHISA
jgi:glutaconate CoA-transferase, subunit A